MKVTLDISVFCKCKTPYTKMVDISNEENVNSAEFVCPECMESVLVEQ